MNENTFRKGLLDGLPIGIGYFSVAFAFGIFALRCGLKGWQAIAISATNLTSAGQIAAVPIIAAQGSLIELAANQLVINMRYFLMSVVLSQKLKPETTLLEKLLIAWCNTDEIFAVCTGKDYRLDRKYCYGILVAPYAGWTLGTAAGVLAGDVLPVIITDALSVAIYGMLIAIFVPAGRDDGNLLMSIIIAVALSLCFYYLPGLKELPRGFTIIICGAVGSLIMALKAPIGGEE